MSSGIKKMDVVWEDEDSGFDPDQKKKQSESKAEFSQLLDKEGFDSTVIRTGERVKGLILSIDDVSEEVLVELSARHTGFIERNQLTDEEGTLKYKKGDMIEAYVVGRSHGTFQLSITMERSRQSAQDLHMAWQNRVPVTGKVIKENKGGFEVTVFGKSAFCPVSQIDTVFVENKAPYIGKDFDFLIETIEEDGRNIVVSRSKLLKIAAERKLVDLKANLKPDDIFDGVIKDIRDYGAFVDIGGIDGFLHVSEMSYSRVSQVRDVVSVGERVRVKILSIEEKDGKTRVSLSMKAIEQDPWLTVTSAFSPLSYYEGKVTRLTKFGAFVELKPGIEGLIHLSEMSWEKRINKPEELLNVGDFVKVRIIEIQPVERRISLSLKDVEANPWHNIHGKFPQGKEVTGKVERLKGYGAIVEIAPGLSGLLPTGTLKQAFGDGYKRKASPPQEITVLIGHIDDAAKRILLSLPQVVSAEDDRDYQQYLAEESMEKKAAPAPQGKVGSFGALLEKQLKGGKP